MTLKERLEEYDDKQVIRACYSGEVWQYREEPANVPKLIAERMEWSVEETDNFLQECKKRKGLKVLLDCQPWNFPQMIADVIFEDKEEV